jgi:hypothetical protein
MFQTVEAVVDAAGRVQLLGQIHIASPRRALVTVLEEPAAVPGEAALLAETGPGGGLVSAGGGRGVVAPTAAEVVLVPFPFSDLSQSKVRPAVCLADAGRGDWVLCQITSSPYGDPMAIPLDVPRRLYRRMYRRSAHSDWRTAHHRNARSNRAERRTELRSPGARIISLFRVGTPISMSSQRPGSQGKAIAGSAAV